MYRNKRNWRGKIMLKSGKVVTKIRQGKRTRILSEEHELFADNTVVSLTDLYEPPDE